MQAPKCHDTRAAGCQSLQKRTKPPCSHGFPSSGAGELKALLMGLSLGGLPGGDPKNGIDAEVSLLMSEFDSNNDGSVSREEFRSSLERWAVCLRPCSDDNSGVALRCGTEG